MTLRRIRGWGLLDSAFSLGRWGLVVNIASLLYLSLVFVFSFFPPVSDPALSTMNWSCVVYAGVLTIAVVYYVGWARHTYVGPVKYIRKAV